MNPSSLRPFIGVGVIVLKEGKVLLGKRKNAHGAGSWSFAGGHLEFGESLEECAHRELKEETSLKPLSTKIGPWTNDLIEHGKHYVTFFVFVDQFAGEPQLLEPEKCEGWHWFDWNDLPYPLFPPISSLIEKMSLKELYSLSLLPPTFSKGQEKSQSLLEKVLNFYALQSQEKKELSAFITHLQQWGARLNPYIEKDPLKRISLEQAQEEIGTFFTHLLYFCHQLQVDPFKAASKVLDKNASST